MTLNSLWWWGFSLSALRNLEYPFIAISPRSTTIQGGRTRKSPIYGSKKGPINASKKGPINASKKGRYGSNKSVVYGSNKGLYLWVKLKPYLGVKQNYSIIH